MGYTAYLLGDDTAKRMGRLSLNPLKHVDIFGTIILPIILFTTAGFAFGYAKPVPINPHNFKDYKKGMGITWGGRSYGQLYYNFSVSHCLCNPDKIRG